jgi:hypothetical protein
MSATKVLRAYIEQGGTAYHMYCHDDTGGEWHTHCDDVYTMAGAVRELENRAFHWGYTHVQLIDRNGEQIGLSYLTATPYRLQRLADRRASTLASAGRECVDKGDCTVELALEVVDFKRDVKQGRH